MVYKSINYISYIYYILIKMVHIYPIKVEHNLLITFLHMQFNIVASAVIGLVLAVFLLDVYSLKTIPPGSPSVYEFWQSCGFTELYAGKRGMYINDEVLPANVCAFDNSTNCGRFKNIKSTGYTYSVTGDFMNKLHRHYFGFDCFGTGDKCLEIVGSYASNCSSFNPGQNWFLNLSSQIGNIDILEEGSITATLFGDSSCSLPVSTDTYALDKCIPAISRIAGVSSNPLMSHIDDVGFMPINAIFNVDGGNLPQKYNKSI